MYKIQGNTFIGCKHNIVGSLPSPCASMTHEEHEMYHEAKWQEHLRKEYEADDNYWRKSPTETKAHKIGRHWLGKKKGQYYIKHKLLNW